MGDWLDTLLGWLSKAELYITDSGNASMRSAEALPNGTKKVLDKVGDGVHNVMNTPLTVTMMSGNLYSPVYTGTADKKPMTYLSTPKQEALQAMAMAAAPALAAGAGTMGIPAALTGVAASIPAGYVGKKVGEGAALMLGLNENALEMFGSVGEFAGMNVGAKIGTNFKGIANKIWDGTLRIVNYHPGSHLYLYNTTHVSPKVDIGEELPFDIVPPSSRGGLEHLVTRSPDGTRIIKRSTVSYTKPELLREILKLRVLNLYDDVILPQLYEGYVKLGDRYMPVFSLEVVDVPADLSVVPLPLGWDAVIKKGTPLFLDIEKVILSNPNYKYTNQVFWTPDRYLIADFGAGHNIGITNSGEPIIFDPMIINTNEIDIFNRMFKPSWLYSTNNSGFPILPFSYIMQKSQGN